jgi:hypothetical protein
MRPADLWLGVDRAGLAAAPRNERTNARARRPPAGSSVLARDHRAAAAGRQRASAARSLLGDGREPRLPTRAAAAAAAPTALAVHVAAWLGACCVRPGAPWVGRRGGAGRGGRLCHNTPSTTCVMSAHRHDGMASCRGGWLSARLSLTASGSPACRSPPRATGAACSRAACSTARCAGASVPHATPRRRRGWRRARRRWRATRAMREGVMG